MAIVEDQKVTMKWNGCHKKYYEAFKNKDGTQRYFYDHENLFDVYVEDLPTNSSKLIKVRCDYCGFIFTREYVKYNISMKNNQKHGVLKDNCKECYHIKYREANGLPEEDVYWDTDESPKENNLYTKETLIKAFYKYKTIFGVYPRKIDMEMNSEYPSATSYQKRWGSWTKFIDSLDIMSNDGWFKEDEEILKNNYLTCTNLKQMNSLFNDKKSIVEINKKATLFGYEERSFLFKREYDLSSNEARVESSLQGIKDLYEDIGKCPCVSEYDNYAKLNGLISRRILSNKLNKTYNQICEPIIGESNKLIKTKDAMLKDLLDLKEKLGRVPLGNELKKYGLLEKKAYMRNFNMTYQEIVIALGWETHSPKLNRKTNEQLLKDYNDLYMSINRLPNSHDLAECEFTASYQTYTNRFGSLENVWDKLGINFEINQNSSSGYISRNLNNEICRSNQEVAISNLLHTNGIAYIPELKYSIISDSIKGKLTMDWYLVDSRICVEYFGLFNEKSIQRNTRQGKYSRKALRKMRLCKDNNVKLISLFPKDILNNCKGVKEKFLAHDIFLNR